MLRIIRVSGESLLPDYKEGDFVVITTIPFFFRNLTSGDVVVFDHGNYGTLIKRVERISPSGEIYIAGTNKNSLGSSRLGPINREALLGKVFWKITSR